MFYHSVDVFADFWGYRWSLLGFFSIKHDLAEGDKISRNFVTLGADFEGHN